MENDFRILKGITENYAVNAFGEVKSLKRKCYDIPNNRVYIIKEKILKPYKNNKGYMCVDLRIKGKTKKYLVHRLVATYFIENPNNMPIINHKDCNPLNNHYTNLEWCTYSHNNKYGYIFGNRVLTEAQVKARSEQGKLNGKPCSQYTLDGKYIRTFASCSEAGRWLYKQGETNSRRCHSNIISCCNRKYKSAYGYIWKYKEV
nr:MAG TPA: homing endonuclease [Crassvirales sp.]